eukprot:UN02032
MFFSPPPISPINHIYFNNTRNLIFFGFRKLEIFPIKIEKIPTVTWTDPLWQRLCPNEFLGQIKFREAKIHKRGKGSTKSFVASSIISPVASPEVPIDQIKISLG